MASNDMNSWDNDADELLRKRWQQAFANFEVQPRPSLSQRILGSLANRHRHRIKRWLVAVLLLLLLTGVGVNYVVRFNKESVSGRTLTPARQPARSSSNRLLSGSEAHSPTPTLKPSKTPGPLEAVGLSTKRPTGHPSTKQNVTQSRSGASSKDGFTAIHQREAIRYNTSAQPRHRARVSLGPPVDELVSGRLGTLTRPYSISVAASPLETVSFSLESLKPNGLKSLATAFSTLPSPHLASPNPASTHAAEPTVSHAQARWFVAVVPQSSFQWMRASTASMEHLSQVGIPAAFSPGTWGYQVQGGLRFRHWQTHLLLGQLRRWATYTVNENRYRVEPSPMNQYELVRKSHVVTENKLLPMIGAGISQYQHLFKGRYSVELGGQVMYLPISDQTLVGLHGSAGRRVVMNRYEGSVGLSFDYGMNQLLNEQKQLSIRPLILGVVFQVQPRLSR